MDELERDDCAIEHFDALLGLTDAPRMLAIDAMMRLLTLVDDDDRTRELLRRYWDVGMKRRSMVHLPYSARFFPPEFDVWMTIRPDILSNAPVWAGLDFDAMTFVFTCDANLRNDMYLRHQWARAERKVAGTEKPPYEVIYEDMDAPQDKRRGPPTPPEDRDYNPPLFADVACPLAKALGDDDLRAWSMMSGAMEHDDFTRSMGAARIDGLDKKLQVAEAEGRIQRLGDNHWRLVGTTYQGQPVDVASLDKNELITGTPSFVDEALVRRQRRAPSMNRQITKLIRETPRDAAIYGVLTQEAVEGLGFGGKNGAREKLLKAILPRPKGLQVAISIADRIGLFTRMPTDNQVKGRLLIALAKQFLEREAADDAEFAEQLRHIDLAEANDKQALLVAYTMSKSRLHQLVWD